MFDEMGVFANEHPLFPILKMIDFGDTVDANRPSTPPAAPVVPNDDDSDDSEDSMELKMKERDERLKAESIAKHDVVLRLADIIKEEKARAAQILRDIRSGKRKGDPTPL